MSDHTRRVKTQWNSYVRPFDSFSDEEISGLLGFCSESTKVAEKFSGKKCFLAYGALLGLERSGKLIPHDFDIDVAIDCGLSTKDEVAELCRKLIIRFLDAGYEVKAKCFAQFFVLPPKHVKPRYKVEFFASWIEEDRFYLYFALPGVNIVDSLFPLKDVELEGHHFLAPKIPEDLLAATYGEDWKIPNPEFKYCMTPDRWAPFTSFFFSRNKKQWDEYYSEKGTSVQCDEDTNSDIDYTLNLPNSDAMCILDIGCGNGKAAIGLANKGHLVTAIDTSQVAIDQANIIADRNSILSFSAEVVNLYDIPEAEDFSSRNEGKFELIMANDLINHISPVGESMMFRLAFKTLSGNGALHISVPSHLLVESSLAAIAINPDKARGIAFYTRKISIETLENVAEEHGFSLVMTSVDNSSNSTNFGFQKVCNVSVLQIATSA